MVARAGLSWQVLYDQKALLLNYLQHERQSMIGLDWRTRMATLEGLTELLDWMLNQYDKPFFMEWEEGSGPP